MPETKTQADYDKDPEYQAFKAKAKSMVRDMLDVLSKHNASPSEGFAAVAILAETLGDEIAPAAVHHLGEKLCEKAKDRAILTLLKAIEKSLEGKPREETPKAAEFRHDLH